MSVKLLILNLISIIFLGVTMWMETARIETFARCCRKRSTFKKNWIYWIDLVIIIATILSIIIELDFIKGMVGNLVNILCTVTYVTLIVVSIYGVILILKTKQTIYITYRSVKHKYNISEYVFLTQLCLILFVTLIAYCGGRIYCVWI